MVPHECLILEFPIHHAGRVPLPALNEELGTGMTCAHSKPFTLEPVAMQLRFASYRQSHHAHCRCSIVEK